MRLSMKLTLDGLIQALRIDAQRLADAVEFSKPADRVAVAEMRDGGGRVGRLRERFDDSRGE